MTINHPLATSSWDSSEISAINRVIASNHYSMGREVSNFENKFSEYFGSRYSVMVNSGSSANLLMIAALFFSENPRLKLTAGDEIIVPAVSWSTTYFPLQQYGLHLKFVDIDLDTLNYNLSELKSAVSDRTKAIMVVNLLGNPNDFDEIFDIIHGRNITVLEDNCESMGARFNEKYTGTFGVMGSFSCFFSHHISTMEGGVVVTDDEELYHIMLSLRAHGWTRNLPQHNHVTGEKSADPFDESFKFVLPGYNLRPLEMSGAIGAEQLLKLDAIIDGRIQNGKNFQEKLKDHALFRIQSEIGSSSWFGFSLVLRHTNQVNRKKVITDLTELGFECRPIVAGNFVKNPVIKYFDYELHGEMVNSDVIDRQGLFVGNHHYPVNEAIDILSTYSGKL